MQPTVTYRGQRYLWGYSPDRQFCGLWEVGDTSGLPSRTWLISEHAAAWAVFRSLEPHAVAYDPSDTVTSQDTVARASTEPFAASAEPFAASAEPFAASAESFVASAESFVASASSTSTLLLDRPAAGAAVQVTTPPAASTTSTDLNVGADVTEVQPSPKSAVDVRLRRRRLLLVAALSVVLVLAAVVGVHKLLPKPATVTPAQAVLTAAGSTQSLHSAHMSMVETVTDHATSKTLSIPATGEVDFSSGGASLDMTIGGQEVSVVSSEGVLYMSTPAISRLVPGKSWLSVPLGNSSATEGGALAGADPTQMLQILASQGNVVSPLGASTVDGVSVQGYSVLINKSVVETELQSSGAPVALVQSTEQVLRSGGEIIYKVYVDASNQLKEMDFSMDVPGASGTVLSAQVTFSDYGAPVTVTPPPASQVATLEQIPAPTA